MPAFHSRQTFDTSCGRYGVICSMVTPARNLSKAMIFKAPPVVPLIKQAKIPVHDPGAKALFFRGEVHHRHTSRAESSRYNFVTGVWYATFRVPGQSNDRCNRGQMEADHRQCAQAWDIAIWRAAARSAGGQPKSAHRATTRTRARRHYRSQNGRKKVGTRRVFPHRIWPNPGPRAYTHGKVG